MLTCAEEKGYWASYRWRAMGCTVEVLLGAAAEHDLLGRWAVGELERLEQSWSRFRPDSELRRINARTGEMVALSDELADAVDTAAELWRLTDGAFDPTVHDALCAWGYDRDFGAVRADETLRRRRGPRPVPAPGLSGLVSVRRGTTGPEIGAAGGGRLLRSPAAIDLGGIGKGLAADRLAEGLLERGARSVLVAVGGDLRAEGTTPAGGWRSSLEDPFADGVELLPVRFERGALVASTTVLRRWSLADAAAHHLIDPTTGAPAHPDLAAVFLSGTAAAWAEGLAKAALVLGAERGAALLARVATLRPGWVTGAWFLTVDRRLVPVTDLSSNRHGAPPAPSALGAA
ncbi:MAG: FAD:protein FMN transferase [Acidimicrobiia bacterium]